MFRRFMLVSIAISLASVQAKAEVPVPPLYAQLVELAKSLLLANQHFFRAKGMNELCKQRLVTPKGVAGGKVIMRDLYLENAIEAAARKATAEAAFSTALDAVAKSGRVASRAEALGNAMRFARDPRYAAIFAVTAFYFLYMKKDVSASSITYQNPPVECMAALAEYVEYERILEAGFFNGGDLQYSQEDRDNASRAISIIRTWFTDPINGCVPGGDAKAVWADFVKSASPLLWEYGNKGPVSNVFTAEQIVEQIYASRFAFITLRDDCQTCKQALEAPDTLPLSWGGIPQGDLQLIGPPDPE